MAGNGTFSIFIVAFENSFCSDYITEKFWSCLLYGNIPIVLGGLSDTDYKNQRVPPHSYINADNYPSPKG